MKWLGSGGDLARYIAEVSTALERVKGLEKDQDRLSVTLKEGFTELDRRMTALEADMKVLRAEVRADVSEAIAERMEASREAFHAELRKMAVAVSKLEDRRASLE